MFESYEEMATKRFPVLEVVIRNLSCNDSDKQVLRELFFTVYSTGYEDGQRSK